MLNDTKPYGNILDFRNQSDEVDKAIALFSGKDNSSRAKEIWLVDPAPKVVEKLDHAVKELRYLSDNYEEAVKKELGSDYQKSELEIQKNGEDLDSYIGELKSVITQYSRSLSPEKLGLHEDEEDHQKIEKARQDFVDDNNKMLYSHNVIPLAVWYIRNLDQVEMLEKQMRRKIHYVIKPAYLWSNIYELARTQNSQLLKTLQSGFKYI